jgi:site-specific recombinase XerD
MTLQIQEALKIADSNHTRRAYNRALREFDKWLNGRDLTFKLARDYRAELVERGWSPQNINAHLTAIRFYAREMQDAIGLTEALAIREIPGVKVKGRKLGNWLSVEEAQKLLNAPDCSTRRGLRNRAMLALLIGAGLRRSEVIGLQVMHFERRDGRWILIGVEGKHGRTRNIPIADWVKGIVDQWTDRAEIKTGFVFRQVSRSEKKDWIKDEPLTAGALFYIVKRYGWEVERGQIAPHDLRRTFARLAFEGNAPIAQIQLVLGHSKQETTERYVNAQQDLQISPGDLLGIEVQT